jgi:hypothetical protein
MRPKRTKKFIDREVQGMLILRVISYWVICSIAVMVMMTWYELLVGESSTFFEAYQASWIRFGPAVFATMLIFPLVLFDMIHFSFRFVGPMFRLRWALRELSQGRNPAPLKFREQDFWKPIAADFDCVANCVEFYRQDHGLDEVEPKKATQPAPGEVEVAGNHNSSETGLKVVPSDQITGT